MSEEKTLDVCSKKDNLWQVSEQGTQQIDNLWTVKFWFYNFSLFFFCYLFWPAVEKRRSYKLQQRHYHSCQCLRNQLMEEEGKVGFSPHLAIWAKKGNRQIEGVIMSKKTTNSGNDQMIVIWRKIKNFTRSKVMPNHKGWDFINRCPAARVGHHKTKKLYKK